VAVGVPWTPAGPYDPPPCLRPSSSTNLRCFWSADVASLAKRRNLLLRFRAAPLNELVHGMSGRPLAMLVVASRSLLCSAAVLNASRE
jgi:hypothetical protein